MQGSLCHSAGVLYVGRHRQDAWVAAYDLDGRSLGTGFRFLDEVVRRSAVRGLAMDGDHRLWVADAPAGQLRAFTLFGQQVAAVGDEGDQEPDVAGCIGSPLAVLASGADEELELWVASGGARRHALHRLRPGQGRAVSLRPEGDPRGRFQRLAGLTRSGSFVYALEAGRSRVQVFRGLEHHYTLGLGGHMRDDMRPTALAALADGRLVVAVEGQESALLLLGQDGGLERILAAPGEDTGQVSHPGALAVVEASEVQDGGPARIFCLDRDGERLQVFTPEGVCYGAFPELVP